MNPNQTPGVRAATEYGFRQIMASGRPQYLHGGIVIDGANARDPLNTGYTDRLRAGMLLGRITSSGLWAPSVLGVTTAAYADDETTLTVSTATASEIVRRIGTSGDLYLTGPPTAGGTVATAAVAFTAVDTGTGEITVLDLNADFIAGSLVRPADGSETILGILGLEGGLKVTDDDGEDIQVECSRLIVGSANGVIDASQIVNYPSDASLQAWIKAALRAVGGGYVFDDDHIG